MLSMPRTATTLATHPLPSTAPAAARTVFALLRGLKIGTLDVQLPDGEDTNEWLAVHSMKCNPY